MPSILFEPQNGLETVKDNGGQVLPNVPVYLIFWGSYWQTQQAQINQVTNATNQILSSNYNYLSALRQYRSNLGSGTYVKSALYPTDPPNNFGQSVINSIVQVTINQGVLPRSSAAIYAVITPPGTQSADQDAGGYHFAGEYYPNPPNPIAWAGTSPSGSTVFNLDYTTTVLSHELVEAASDPNPYGVPDGIRVTSGNGELADNEAQNYRYRLNYSGVVVQSYWSEEDGAYIVPDGNQQKFIVNNTTLVINGDQEAANANDTITLDTTATGRVKVTLNDEVASFDLNNIQSIIVKPGGGQNTIYVSSVPSGSSVAISSTGTDTIHLGNAVGSVQNIKGSVSIINNGNGSNTALVVDDSWDASAHTVTLNHQAGSNGTYGTITGLAPATITYPYAGNTQLTIRGGKGNDTFIVAGAPAVPMTTLDGGAGTNTVQFPAGAVSTAAMSLVNMQALVINGGTLNVSAGTNVSVQTVTVSSGTLNLVGGSVTAPGGLTVQQAGVLSGNGTLTANVSNAGQVNPGGTGAAGLITITGNYTQTGTGHLNIEIGGVAANQYDRLAVSGVATLGGYLNVAMIGGFKPALNDAFTILTFSSLKNNFLEFDGWDLSPNMFDILYHPTDITLAVVPIATTFEVTASANPVTAGTAFSITVTALNAYGQVAESYLGKVHFTSSDPAAVLPADYTFTLADVSTHTFSVTLKTAGNQTITATDTTTGTSPITGSVTVTVTPAAVKTFLVAGFPSPIVAGTAGNFTVTAKDSYGNTVTGYKGTIRFTSSDPQAQLPPTYTFVAADNGTHTFSATLDTLGTQALTATDTVTSSVTGTQTGIGVISAGMTDLGTLGGTDSYAYGINDAGQVVGGADNANNVEYAFLWQNGVMTNLGTLPNTNYSVATAINAGGEVVGRAVTFYPLRHAFLWQNGVMTDLGTLGGTISQADGINAIGQVVGQSTTAAGYLHAFLWQSGKMTDLGTLPGDIGSYALGINKAGQIVGVSSSSAGGNHAFLWQNGVMTSLGTLGGTGSAAYGINDSGQVVGDSSLPGNTISHAFLWQNGKMTDLGSLPGDPNSFANAINDAGTVVGAATDTNNVFHAFKWTPTMANGTTGVMTYLGTLGGSWSAAFSINTAGQIVGAASTVSGADHAFLDNPGSGAGPSQGNTLSPQSAPLAPLTLDGGSTFASDSAMIALSTSEPTSAQAGGMESESTAALVEALPIAPATDLAQTNTTDAYFAGWPAVADPAATDLGLALLGGSRA